MSNCVDCYLGCGEKISDKCVIYTGENGIDSLSAILTGIPMLSVITTLMSILNNVGTGYGITLDTNSNNTITTCTYFDTLNTSGGTGLVTFIQTLASAVCDLNNRLLSVVSQSYIFNLSCLSGVTGTSSRDAILQATIDKTCLNSASISTINSAGYQTAAQVQNLINNQGTTNLPVYSSRMIPYSPIPYIGTLTNFDTTGKGKQVTSSGDWSKIYVCNGNNGTPNLLGKGLIGANGSALGFSGVTVQPDINGYTATIGYNTPIPGEYQHKLSITEMPRHSHLINDRGHTHGVQHSLVTTPYTGGGIGGGSPAIDTTINTDSQKTGISLDTNGGDVPHNNITPSYGVVYIIYLP